MSLKGLSSLCIRLTSTQSDSKVAKCLAARVVARSARPTTALPDTRRFLVASFTTGRAFATFTCGASGEERKRTVLASYRKRADILYHPNGKSMILVLIKKSLMSIFSFILFLKLDVRFVEANL